MRKLKEEIYALDSIISEIQSNIEQSDKEYVIFWKNHIIYLQRIRTKLLKELTTLKP